MTDIEARARAYALCTIGGAPGDSDDREGMAKAYLAGARAEVERERKRIEDALKKVIRARDLFDFVMRPDEISQLEAAFDNILEGDE